MSLTEQIIQRKFAPVVWLEVDSTLTLVLGLRWPDFDYHKEPQM